MVFFLLYVYRGLKKDESSVGIDEIAITTRKKKDLKYFLFFFNFRNKYVDINSTLQSFSSNRSIELD